MNLKVLSSSSKGNSYILESPTGSLLIEAGIPWKNILQGLEYDIREVVGCLCTHEHKDHSKAILDVAKAGIDVYTSQGTIDALGLSHYRLNAVEGKEQFSVGDFTIVSFDTEHDAQDPRGFLIQYTKTGEKLLFITDSYYSKYKFRDINYLMIECNYIKDTLDANIANGYVDEAMKRRLLESHFSLEHVKDFLRANDLSQCRKIILLHLSDANSDAKRMIQEIEGMTGIETVVADAGLELELSLYPY
jgi:phosphoribosyl 1,2-cyclic phosphodiesterase